MASLKRAGFTADEGGHSDFWDDDIDSELDNEWAAIINKKTKLKSLVNFLMRRKNEQRKH